MSNNLPTQYQSDLDYIQSKHESATAKAISAVQDAIECGEALIALKQKCQHGEFVNLVTANTSVSVRTAQRYMKAARNKELLLSRTDDPDAVESMSLMALVNLDKRSEPAPISDKWEYLAEQFCDSHEQYMWAHKKMVRGIQGWAQDDELWAKKQELVPEDAPDLIRAVEYARDHFHEIDWDTMYNEPDLLAQLYWDARAAHFYTMIWILQANRLSPSTIGAMGYQADKSLTRDEFIADGRFIAVLAAVGDIRDAMQSEGRNSMTPDEVQRMDDMAAPLYEQFADAA